MLLLSLAYHSLKNRILTTALTVFSIGLSIALLIGVENVRVGARESFANTISQTDLIVGARGGSLQLLLYTVFRIGSATNNISYETYDHWKNHKAVAWTIPYSLGDSHRGFRVVGTDENFYKHYRFRRDKSIEFASGRAPSTKSSSPTASPPPPAAASSTTKTSPSPSPASLPKPPPPSTGRSISPSKASPPSTSIGPTAPRPCPAKRCPPKRSPSSR